MLTAVIATDKDTKLPVLIGVFRTEKIKGFDEQKVSEYVSRNIVLDKFESIRYVPVGPTDEVKVIP